MSFAKERGEPSEGEQLRLLSAAAHELKTPLSIISQLASALSDDDLVAMTPGERRMALERIQLSAERTLRLVHGLISSYQVGQNDQLALALDLEPLNIAEVCEGVAHELAPFAAQYQQVIELHFSSRSQLVVGQRELLQSVIGNMIDNAIRHNPPETRVDVRSRRANAHVRLQVHDSGPGLARRDVARLRDRLGQHVQPLAARAGGGLGIYIASQLAAAMGARLGVGRPATGGASFFVDLLCSQQLSLI